MAKTKMEKAAATQVTNSEAREKALEHAMEQIQKQYGKGAIVNIVKRGFPYLCR